MSYTAPQYVDTKEQAILALASTIKGEAVTGGDGSVNRALDVLADVLAEQDVQVPQTDAGAILALAQYVTGGGGGGGEAHSVKCYSLDEQGVATEVESFVYRAVFDNQHGYFAPDTESPAVTSAHAGDVLATYTDVTSPLTLYNTIDFYGGNVCVYPGDSSFGFTAFVMPDTDVCVAYMGTK